MKNTQFLFAAAVLVSSPAVAAPPNEVYSFDVISDVETGLNGKTCPDPNFPFCQNLTTPYPLATLTVTHKAFAPDHAATLDAGPGNATGNGVVSFTFSPGLSGVPWGGALSYPIPANLAHTSEGIHVNVALEGNDVEGKIDAELVEHAGCGLTMMSALTEGEWIGQWFCPDLSFHTFTATVTRRPAGIASQ
jgi:hypothetical protein